MAHHCTLYQPNYGSLWINMVFPFENEYFQILTAQYEPFAVNSAGGVCSYAFDSHIEPNYSYQLFTAYNIWIKLSGMKKPFLSENVIYWNFWLSETWFSTKACNPFIALNHVHTSRAAKNPIRLMVSNALYNINERVWSTHVTQISITNFQFSPQKSIAQNNVCHKSVLVRNGKHLSWLKITETAGNGAFVFSHYDRNDADGSDKWSKIGRTRTNIIIHSAPDNCNEIFESPKSLVSLASSFYRSIMAQQIGALAKLLAQSRAHFK